MPVSSSASAPPREVLQGSVGGRGGFMGPWWEWLVRPILLSQAPSTAAPPVLPGMIGPLPTPICRAATCGFWTGCWTILCCLTTYPVPCAGYEHVCRTVSTTCSKYLTVKCLRFFSICNEGSYKDSITRSLSLYYFPSVRQGTVMAPSRPTGIIGCFLRRLSGCSERQFPISLIVLG